MNAVIRKYLQWVCYTLVMCGLGSLNIPSLSLSTSLSAQEIQQPKTNEQAKTLTTSHEDVRWLKSELRAPKKHDGLIYTDAADVKKFEALLLKTLKAKNDAEKLVTDFHDQWAELHWQINLSPSGAFFSIRETVNHRHGRGVYAFRIDDEIPIALQAPHRFNDIMTSVIARKLFCEHSISSIAMNTVNRKEIDLSHTKIHYINAFTSAVIKAQHDISIVQLHGFSNEKKEGAAAFAQAIVSDTTKFPSRSARQTALELKTIFGKDSVRLFPIDVRELGGTINRQAKVAHNLGCPNFLHIELNHEFRSELQRDTSVRNSFFASLPHGIAQ